jgi:hypothetical protein
MARVTFSIAVELSSSVGPEGEAKADQWMRSLLQERPEVEAIYQDETFLCGFVDFHLSAPDSPIEGFLVVVRDTDVVDGVAPSWLVESLASGTSDEGIKFGGISRAIATTQ